MNMEGYDREKEEEEEEVSHEETNECKVIIGEESQLHSISTEVFEGTVKATMEQPEAVNVATLLLLKGEEQSSKKKRRRQQVLMVGIG